MFLNKECIIKQLYNTIPYQIYIIINKYKTTNNEAYIEIIYFLYVFGVKHNNIANFKGNI